MCRETYFPEDMEENLQVCEDMLMRKSLIPVGPQVTRLLPLPQWIQQSLTKRTYSRSQQYHTWSEELFRSYAFFSVFRFNKQNDAFQQNIQLMCKAHSQFPLPYFIFITYITWSPFTQQPLLRIFYSLANILLSPISYTVQRTAQNRAGSLNSIFLSLSVIPPLQQNTVLKGAHATTVSWNILSSVLSVNPRCLLVQDTCIIRSLHFIIQG